MIILENIELKKYSTFYVGGVCRYFIEINNKEDIVNAFDFIKFKKQEKEINDFYILGMGSNTVFSDNLSRMCILKINIKNENYNYINNIEKLENTFEVKKVIDKNKTNYLVKANAGCEWDDLVLFCCQNNYSGLENLSYIPGTVGAAPVQNIGAYGIEVKDYIKSIEVYNIENNIFEILENNLNTEKKEEENNIVKNNNLEFEYRDSLFKKNKNKYLILSVTFLLNKNKNNKDVKYEGLDILESDNLLDIRNSIISIRKSKLPEWRDVSNCGSFFKNPIITKEELDFVLSKNKDLKYFEVLGSAPSLEIKYKLSSAQIIDSLNLKGLEIGGAKVSPTHALILINKNREATFQDVFSLSEEMISKVSIFYKIILEREVNMI